MSLDPETVHLITAHTAAMTTLTKEVQHHESQSEKRMDQLLISSNESVGVQKQILATLNNGLVQEIGDVLASQMRCEEDKKRATAIAAGRKPKSRWRDSMWSKVALVVLASGIGLQAMINAVKVFIETLLTG
jgi:hypothetical protein